MNAPDAELPVLESFARNSYISRRTERTGVPPADPVRIVVITTTQVMARLTCGSDSYDVAGPSGVSGPMGRRGALVALADHLDARLTEIQRKKRFAKRLDELLK